MEQGYREGPVQRSRKSLSTSAPVPKSEGEAMKDTDVQMQQPPQKETETSSAVQASLESPRRCGPAVRAPSPRPAASSRSASMTCANRKSSRHSAAQSWPVEPPVTRATLSELDVSKIIHNPKLRHDINFDPELHFRPNLDGDKGRRKQERANQFWKTLKEELTEFLGDRSAFYEKHGQRDEWTLPALLKAVKEIIQTLVPQRDRQLLDEGFNLELLMQQFYKGMADLEKLALWLSRVLKSHCAPMRDDWVDSMYTQLSNGNRNSNLDELVAGMRSLLGVLEAMKLDVANHQIRCLRPVLIEDTTHFEQKFFLRKMHSRKVDVSGARQWYRDAEMRYTPSMRSMTQSFGDMGVFFQALTRLVLPSTSGRRVPRTFLFDEERIMKLRSDMLDAINLEVCMRVYESLETMGRFSTKILRASRAFDEELYDRCASPSGDFDFNTPPSSSRPSSLVFSQAGSAPSSSRSSLALPSYVDAESSEARTKARMVLDSLISLLNSAAPTSRPQARWQELAPCMAVQIFRFVNVPQDIYATMEEQLVDTLCNANTALYLEVEQSFHSRLMGELELYVREFKALSGVALFAMATGGRVNSSGLVNSARDRDVEASLRNGLEEGSVEDLATRLAHLGILHWRVWAQLVYLGDDVSLDVPPTQT